MDDLELAKSIALKVKERGGTTYFVGGYVRDTILNKENKDIDIEIHSLKVKDLENILDTFGKRKLIGESFGVYNISGYTLDIVLPRSEKLIGMKHQDFECLIDPYLGVYKSAKRRDFTINSLYQNVLTGEIIDNFNGLEDLKNGIIRYIDEDTFQEDALRVLRGANFRARYNFKIDENTLLLMQKMDISHLPKERIEEEVKKTLLKTNKPSLFFETLRNINQLDYYFKELENLIDVAQNTKYHQEGDVWTHTMLVIDSATKYREEVSNPYAFMLAALTHDMGKIMATTCVNGVIHSYNHEKLGIDIIKSFLMRFTHDKEVIKYVLNLTLHHMEPRVCARNNSRIKVTNKMFDSVIDKEGLIYLALSDNEGKIPKTDSINYLPFLKERLEIYREYMARPYVNGEDLIKAGIKPNKYFREYLEYAHKLRIAGIDKNTAFKNTLGFIRKNERKNGRNN